MKFDLDAARYVLLEMEKQPYGEILQFDDLAARSSSYQRNALQYACLKLREAGLIHALTIGTFDSEIPFVDILVDISFQGHQFLEQSRSAKSWELIKSVARGIGNFSLSALATVAQSVTEAAVASWLSAHPLQF